MRLSVYCSDLPKRSLILISNTELNAHNTPRISFIWLHHISREALLTQFFVQTPEKPFSMTRVTFRRKKKKKKSFSLSSCF